MSDKYCLTLDYRCRFINGSPEWHCNLLAIKLKGKKDEKRNVVVITPKQCPCLIMWKNWRSNKT